MISIFGSGIAGLTAAFELVKKGFKINIFEKDSTAGGMAKSKRINGIHSEHSWRAYGNFYENIFNIFENIPIKLKEITLEDVVYNKWVIYKGEVYDIKEFIKIHPGGSIIEKALGNDLEKVWQENNVGWHMTNDNILSILKKYKIGYLKGQVNIPLTNTVMDNLQDELKITTINNDIEKKNYFKIIYEVVFIVYEYLQYATNEQKEILYQNMNLKNWISGKNISRYTQNYISNSLVSQGLGLDPDNVSVDFLFHFSHLYLNGKHKKAMLNVMNKPTSEAFIEPFVELLKKLGVSFFFNSELVKLNVDNNKIISSVVKINNKEQLIKSDDFIVAINPNYCEQIFRESNLIKLADQHQQISVVNNQLSFRLGFNKKINCDKNAFVLIDSLYNISFIPQDEYFNVRTDLNNNIKSLWSGICTKPKLTLNINELLQEIIKQILDCKILQEHIKKYNDFYLTKEDFIYTEIWEDWVWNSKLNILESKNKKWVNTITNEKYRPEQKTDIDNLYLSGAHTKTSTKIWLMEGACESGKLTANLILSKNNLDQSFLYTHKKPVIFNYVQNINKKYPSLLTMLKNILYLYILYKILNYINDI
jgi:uncharacterized protein with NAD-binding domain and iron-sulfur cluster